MKLTDNAIRMISERPVRLKLAYALGFTEVWIERLIQKNKDNGDLTTIKAINTIIEETGLSLEEIVCEDAKNGLENANVS